MNNVILLCLTTTILLGFFIVLYNSFVKLSRNLVFFCTNILNQLKKNLVSAWQAARIQQVNQTLEQQLQEQAQQLLQTNQKLANKILEQQQTEIALRESEERYRDLFENANDLIQCVTPDGKFVYVNQAWKNTLEYNDSELENLTIFNIIHPDCLEHCLEIFQRIMSGENINEVEAKFISKSGKEITVAGSINCKFDQGQPVSTRGIFRNITERKQAEAEIYYALAKERELVELKSRFVTTVSHEFRTPLTVIMMSIKLLEKFGDQIPKEKKQLYFERIQVAGNHITNLLDDLLTASRIESGKLHFSPTYLDLEKTCQEIIEQLQLSTTSKHTINFTCIGQVSQTYLDEQLIRHILINLLSNAIKYSPQGGDITFYLTYNPQEIIFTIQDRGIGIPEEEQKYLFDSFYRASNTSTIPGTGLGMSIVKQCVELHKGSIYVESQVGVGTTVTVVIPRQD
ncbi:PAS domain-containing sensor histidine kinase [Chroococcidiopsis sp. TS-821]|uniref:PAS domain-containing sensor histidine kinase n=1 Tax=Chroococcidiopsis sp. TS-821 TaxID=1378066 RepID=UPI000CEDDD3C|nr:PAS domain-containing sensor histidine kinase [Chroococcidiopsis sp. TS-821]PPS41022.1 hypothetical protein B1A85_19150 [Chroococcidiopsis sp. TS-821]